MFYLCQRCHDEGRGDHNGPGIDETCGECWKADLQAARRMSARWKAGMRATIAERRALRVWRVELAEMRDAIARQGAELAALREAVERAKCPDYRIGRRSSPCAECEEAWMSLTKGGE